MEIRYSTEAEAYRARVRSFLADQLPPDWRGIGALDGAEHEKFVANWREVLHRHGFLAVTWPKEYGGAGLSPLEHVVLAEEFARVGVPLTSDRDVIAIDMLGNTLLRHGTDEQKRRFLPRILSGEDIWCQGYSEPNAGSDLAGVTCRAALDGDEWVIDGQKIWTSNAHEANWIFVLCRTDRTAARHRGLTFLLCPMDQAGIEVRPITMMSGGTEFNEVFFNCARTGVENVVGAVDGGWEVALALLGFERGQSASTMAIEFRAELDRLLVLARDRGRDHDPIVRNRLARCYERVEVMRFLGYRAVTAFLAGQAPGPESSFLKVYWSEYHQEATELAVEILGADALVPSGRPPGTWTRADDVGAPNSSASWATVFLTARAETIYAGTSEVQRNIIAERVLGLPRM